MERQCTTSVVVTPLPRTCMFGGLGLSVVPGGFASLPVRLYHQWSHAEEACANGLCGAGRARPVWPHEDPERASRSDSRPILRLSTCSTKLYRLCDPWMGQMGAPFERVFKPNFLAATRKVWDEYSPPSVCTPPPEGQRTPQSGLALAHSRHRRTGRARGFFRTSFK